MSELILLEFDQVKAVERGKINKLHWIMRIRRTVAILGGALMGTQQYCQVVAAALTQNVARVE